MALDIEKLAAELGDDLELTLGEQKVKAGDLKAYLAEQGTRATSLEQKIAQQNKELERLTDFEKQTTALMGEAARVAAQDTGTPNHGATGAAANLSPADDEFGQYANDPVFGDYTKKFEKRLLSRLDENYFKPWVEKSLQPTIESIRNENRQLTQLLLQERQQREYREAGEWPEGTDLTKALQYGAERRYFLPGTEQVDPRTRQMYGIVDLRRVHNEVTEPVRRSRWEAEVKQKAEDDALAALRQRGVVVPMPNRDMSASKPLPKPGKNESVWDAVLGPQGAGGDMETLRALSGGRR